MRVVVAMSGGVDSSTTAALLVEQGHEVIGLAMKTHDGEPRGSRACCTPDDMRDARRVADHLGIPFWVLPYAELFREQVVRPFADAYRAGRTPNPCVDCNDKVKFRPLLARARLLGAAALATGHYARLTTAPDGTRLLRRARDAGKDQSYFLYRLGAEQLAHVIFPLGELTKDEVRAHARRLGLPVADKDESQEICFVGSDGYAATVERIAGGGRAGDIVGADGRALGRHAGVHHFTIGQRRGLGLAAPEPLYVTGVDADSGTVRVGPRTALAVETVDLEELRWTAGAPDPDRVVHVQLRYRATARAARLETLGPDRMRVRFLEPEPRGAPGQAAVVYDGETVLGGGTIASPARLPLYAETAS